MQDGVQDAAPTDHVLFDASVPSKANSLQSSSQRYARMPLVVCHWSTCFQLKTMAGDGADWISLASPKIALLVAQIPYNPCRYLDNSASPVTCSAPVLPLTLQSNV